MLLCTKIYYGGTCFNAQSDDDNDHVVDDDDGLGNRGEGSLCGENHDDIICLYPVSLLIGGFLKC